VVASEQVKALLGRLGRREADPLLISNTRKLGGQYLLPLSGNPVNRSNCLLPSL
jgi:hypothetical protein